MTGEPGKQEEPTQPPEVDAAKVADRTSADAEAALRQYELDQQRQQAQPDDAIAEKPLDADAASNASSRQQTVSTRPRWFTLRTELGLLPAILLGIFAVLFFLGLWWFLTRGEISEERIVSATTLPSPAETFGQFKELWFDRALTRNAWVTIRRVTIGFALAAMIGIPVGVLAGCFAPFRALLAPVVIFGRNIPLAALIPLTFFMFGIGEYQKVMFIFIACVAFIIADATNAIIDVSQKYVDTAYTLGANRWQTIIKVLVPLAMPAIFNSLRLLFGLAFGYIMLAELVKMGGEEGGLGHLINVSQRRGPREHIYLIIIIIPVIALLIDRSLYWVQRQLFPHRYGSIGVLHQLVREVVGLWDDFKKLLFSPKPPFDQLVTGDVSANSKQPDDAAEAEE